MILFARPVVIFLVKRTQQSEPFLLTFVLSKNIESYENRTLQKWIGLKKEGIW